MNQFQKDTQAKHDASFSVQRGAGAAAQSSAEPSKAALQAAPLAHSSEDSGEDVPLQLQRSKKLRTNRLSTKRPAELGTEAEFKVRKVKPAYVIEHARPEFGNGLIHPLGGPARSGWVHVHP